MKVGSLFTGYGGLDLALSMLSEGAETTWVSDIEPGPKKIIERRFPGVPNLGDITTIDWATVPDVDVIVGGSPCQDLSSAGLRAGMKPGTRSGLWESMWHAIQAKQPRLVVWENVGGAYSAEAFCSMEQGTGCLGNGPGRPALRALGRVLGDLASIGYDARWASVRASDVGAPHRRERVFVVAYPGSGGPETIRLRERPGEEHAATNNGERLLPTPQARDHHGVPGDGFNLASLPREIALLPTPTAQAAKHSADDRGPGTRDDGNLWSIAGRMGNEKLLPTPRTQDGGGGSKDRAINREQTYSLELRDFAVPDRFGDYADAIARWERVLGRSAPPPTEPGPNGNPRLAAPFVEWMMGLPKGWVTDVPISRALQLRALGNGIVPLQCAYAIHSLINTTIPEGAAA